MAGAWFRRLALLGALVLLVGCGGDDDASGPTTLDIGGTATARGEAAWPAPPSDQVAALADDAGLPLETKEHLAYHVHAHLDVFIDGEDRIVPAGIGIVIDDPGVRTFEELGGTGYGGIEGCDQPCISPLHTHFTTGVLHTESQETKANTLGQFFVEWDVALTETCVGDYCTPDTPIRVFVDGEEQPLAGAADIELTDRREIALVIGDPPSRIPDSADFSHD